MAFFGNIGVYMWDHRVQGLKKLNVGDRTQLGNRIKRIESRWLEVGDPSTRLIQFGAEHFNKGIVTDDHLMWQGRNLKEYRLFHDHMSLSLYPALRRNVPKTLYKVLEQIVRLAKEEDWYNLIQEYKKIVEPGWLSHIYATHPEQREKLWARLVEVFQETAGKIQRGQKTMLFAGNNGSQLAYAIQQLALYMGQETRFFAQSGKFSLERLGEFDNSSILEGRLQFKSPITTLRVYRPRRRHQLYEIYVDEGDLPVLPTTSGQISVLVDS